MNTFTFADSATLAQKLTSVDDTGGDVERFLNRFALKMGEQTRNAAGVVLGWNLIVHDLASQMGATPMLGLMLNLIFEDCMIAIIDDPQFLADVLEFARQAQMI